MSWKLRTLVSLSCAVMAGQALAAELDTRPYIVPSVNYTVTDNNWKTEDDFGFGLGVGKPITEHLNLELNGTYGEYSRKNGMGATGNVKNTGLMLDALYVFNRNAVSPYLVVGAGGLQSRATGLSETNWAANAGVGVMAWIHDIAIRGDVRYRYVNSVGGYAGGKNMDDWVATAGLMIPLGPKPVPPAPAPEPMPAPAPVVAPEPAPQPAPAIERPAPQTKIIFEGTNFDFDKATLRPAGKAKLDENVKTLMAYPDINVDIVGYTDSIGTAKYNQGLSNRRAATVKKYMESKGVAASRMNTKGMGEKDPVASNKTAAGRAENRRVEIVILN
jgi:OOP family OmpA-OmpF porin